MRTALADERGLLAVRSVSVCEVKEDRMRERPALAVADGLAERDLGAGGDVGAVRAVGFVEVFRGEGARGCEVPLLGVGGVQGIGVIPRDMDFGGGEIVEPADGGDENVLQGSG